MSPTGEVGLLGGGTSSVAERDSKQGLDSASLPLRDTASANPRTLGWLVLLDVGLPAWQHD